MVQSQKNISCLWYPRKQWDKKNQPPIHCFVCGMYCLSYGTNLLFKLDYIQPMPDTRFFCQSMHTHCALILLTVANSSFVKEKQNNFHWCKSTSLIIILIVILISVLAARSDWLGKFFVQQRIRMSFNV